MSNCKLSFASGAPSPAPSTKKRKSTYPSDWFLVEVEDTGPKITNHPLKSWLKSNPNCVPSVTIDKKSGTVTYTYTNVTITNVKPF